MRQKDLAVFAVSLALNRGAHAFAAHIGAQSLPKHRQIGADAPAADGLPFGDAEESAGGVVTGQDDAIPVRGQDRRRAALGEQPELFLGFAAECLFRLLFRKVLDHQLLIANQHGDEEARQEICGRGKDKTQRQFEERTMPSPPAEGR